METVKSIGQKVKSLDLETLNLEASKDRGHIEEEVSTTSGIRGPNDEFVIAVCGYRPRGDGKYESEWHTIMVQDPDPERPYSSGNLTINKEPLYPAVRMMYKIRQHVALGSYLYSLGGLYPVGSESDSDSDGDIAHPFESKRYRRVWRLDVNRPSAGWEAVPPMTFPNRYDPPSVALQGKLYVLGGFFKSQFPAEAKELGWMEAYDPISNTWEPLPNPPSGFFLDADPLIFTALESKNQILVARYNHDDLICDSATFCIYDVITRSWTKLEPPRMLFARYPDQTERRSIAVGNTLYWGLLEDEDIIVQAYDLDMDRWIHGRFNIRPFVAKDEFPADNIFPASPPLLHLNNQRFCLFFLTSCYDRNTCQVSNPYLNCLILDISPINDEGKPHEQHDYHVHDHKHFWRLNISIESSQKFPLVNPIQLWDAVLLKQTWFPETGFSKKEGGVEEIVTVIVINDKAHDSRSLLSSSKRGFLVRNNGDQVKIESLKGKKLALYFSASWGGISLRFTQILIEVYNELSSKGDFEVIFVWVDEDEESFKGNFSKMPWLAIPFSDSKTRGRLEELFQVRGIPHCVILDEDGKVVSDNGVEIIQEYGIEAYPFTQQKIKDLKDQEEAARKNQSLRSILVSHSHDFVISSDGKKVYKVPVSELEGKTVGLYFSWLSCYDNFIQKLDEVYKILKAKGENFEIVWIPLGEDEELFNQVFKSLHWFALPVKDKSCERLAWYFKVASLPTLVIIGPDGKTLQSNVYGAIYKYGVLAYPFTPERFTELAEKEALTLESILVSGDKDFVIGKDGVKIPVTDLVGKKILLHFSAHWYLPCCTFLPQLMDAYHKIKAKDDAFEVIFISSDKDQASFDEFFSGMPWLALPFGDPRKASLSRTFKVRSIPLLVAIGPSGKTVTKEARDILMIDGADAYPLIDELLKEI